MKSNFRRISIITAIIMLFSVQFSFTFAETAMPAEPLVIIHTNDIHSNVTSGIGYPSVKGWKDYYIAQGSEVLVLDAGDALHGYPIANLSQGENIVKIMNAVGYDAMCPGNHDFNYGTARLIELSKKMNFDLLSVNFTDMNKSHVFTASKTYIAGDKKIGIIGISTPETATKTNPLNVAGYQFNEKELATQVQGQIDQMEADGADYIIALGHLGVDVESAPYRSTDLIGQLIGLDIFIDGHSHTTLEAGEIVKDKSGNDVLLAQTGNQFKAIGKIVIDGTSMEASLITEGKDDAQVKSLIENKMADIKPLLDIVVAKTSVKLDGNRDPGVRTQETNLGDLAADALKFVSGADVALTNGGGIRTSLEIGDITYGEINSVFPFGNTVVTFDIKGSDILEALQHGTKTLPAANGGLPQVAGMDYEVHTYLDTDRVKNVMINGKPLDLKGTYTMATNDFTYAGGDGYTMFAKYPKTGEFGALDEALEEYIKTAQKGTVGNQYMKAQGRFDVMLTPFKDVISHWAKRSIAASVDAGLFEGISETVFQPNAPMTRGMFVTVLGRASAVDISAYTESKFKDVDMNTWYGGYIEWAAENGIASGTGMNFEPNSAISREQIATMLTNYCTYNGTGPVGMWAIQMHYTDIGKMSEWANEGVMFATMKKYMSGYPNGSFGPQNYATRAEVATIMSRYLTPEGIQ
jgi:5'-nucleotidase / UDP-sugar diphosphatase